MEDNVQVKIPAVCRTCLNEIRDGCQFSLSDWARSDIEQTKCTFRHKLINLLPELNVSLALNAVICISCAGAVESAYKFKKKCLSSEEHIHNLAEKIGCIAAEVDLRQLVQHMREDDRVNVKSEDVELVDEVKEEQMDITLFDIFKNECLDIRKEKIDNSSANIKLKQTPEEQEPSFETVIVNPVLFSAYSSILIEDENSEHECNGDHNDTPEIFETKDSGNGFTQNEESAKIIFKDISMHTEEKPYDAVTALQLNDCETADSEDKLFKCSQCRFSARRQRFLKNHMLRVHGKNGSTKIFKCTSCSYSTVHKHHLDNHIRTHTGEKPFKCAECNYSTTQSTHLNTHMWIHSEDRRYKCTKCDYCCNQKSHLKIHMRNHLGVRPYTCSMCKFSGTTRSAVNIHMRTHTGEKLYKCTTCNYRGAQQSALLSHMKVHNTANYCYNCNDCDYTTVYRSSLVAHLRIHKRCEN